MQNTCGMHCAHSYKGTKNSPKKPHKSEKAEVAKSFYVKLRS
jgi:hypothetical protein